MAFNGFTDRVVEHPGRVIMTPVQGEANTYDMSRAEGNVTTEGTPFNAETFNGIADDIIEEADDNIITANELQTIAQALDVTPAKLAGILNALVDKSKRKTQLYSSASANLAANTYVDKTVNIGVDPDGLGRTAVFRGFNITGTGTSNVQCLGTYISGNITDGFTGHVKIKNDSGSQIGPVTADMYVLWIKI